MILPRVCIVTSELKQWELASETMKNLKPNMADNQTANSFSEEMVHNKVTATHDSSVVE